MEDQLVIRQRLEYKKGMRNKHVIWSHFFWLGQPWRRKGRRREEEEEKKKKKREKRNKGMFLYWKHVNFGFLV